MATHFRIVDHSRPFLREVERLVDRRLDYAAEDLRNSLEQNVSQPGPAPSAEGEYPHKQEGELAGSFYWHRTPKGDRVVGSTAAHALPLEKKPPDAGGREFMMRTLRERWQRILRIMAGRR